MKQVVTKPSDKIGKWKFPWKKFIYEKTVLLKQTNLIGNVYFVNYVEWQGEAREALLLAHPTTAEFLKKEKHIKLVTYCLYHRFLVDSTFGEVIRIELTTRDILTHSLVIVFKYFNVGTNVLIGEGWQKICFLDTRVNEICITPQLILDLAESIREDKNEEAS